MPMTVSYTHLDVYKRQGLDGLVSVENFDTSLAEDVMLMTPFTAAATEDKTAAFVKAYNCLLYTSRCV